MNEYGTGSYTIIPEKQIEVPKQIKKKKNSPRLFYLIIFCLIIAVIILGKKITTRIKETKEADYVIQKYIQAENVSDYEGIYDCFYLPKSKFLTKDRFLATQEELKPWDIYHVEYYPSNEGCYTQTEGEHYRISFESNRIANSELDIYLLQDEDKTYKINPEYLYVCNDSYFYVPTNANLIIDDIKVSKDYLDSEHEQTDDVAIYKVPLFMGQHHLKVIGNEECVPYEKNFSVGGRNNKEEVYTFSLTANEQKNLKDFAINMYIELLTGAAQNIDYTKLKTIPTENSKECKEYYLGLKNDALNLASTISLTDLTCICSDTYSSDGYYSAVVDARLDYKADQKREQELEDYSLLRAFTEAPDYYPSRSMTFNLKKENNELTLISFTVN